VNTIAEAIGELCKIILPIPEEYYVGNQNSSIAVCTLSSIDLLKKFHDSKILNDIAIAGRLLSENKGIDSIIKYVHKNQHITTIIVCGKDVWGHKSGQSLFALYKYGIDENNKIINSISPDPYLTVTNAEIQYFQNHITLVDMIGETNLNTIFSAIKNSL